MAPPTANVPLLVVAETDETVGGDPSTTNALFAANEPDAPGDASVNVASFPATSLIVPLFKVNAEVLV